MKLLAILIIINLCCIYSLQAAPNIQNLQARVHAGHIYVQWQFPGQLDNVIFNIRYRLKNDPNWKFSRSREPRAVLRLDEFKQGDEIHLQVQTERAGAIIEDWGQELVATVGQRLNVGGISMDPSDLLPPLDFTAHVLGPTSVKLEWKPNEGVPADVYYVVNIKQLTSETSSPLQRQQIKTSANSFSLNKLVPGERYEMTIRSATGEKTSPTAAIVEMTMPREEDYFEIGNLIISSHFLQNGHGTVNLTWTVPQRVSHKVIRYEVKYVEAANSDGEWKTIQFQGPRSTAILNNLKSNTEYLLRITTTLYNNAKVESGQFKFKTPKIDANPIQKVDVIYSHDINSVKLQWVLEPHINKDKVAGYDVYYTDNKGRPDSQWRFARLDSPEGSLSLDNLASSTVYYVRVNVRNNDGSIIRAPSIYKFTTIDKSGQREALAESNSLAYKNVALGKVEINWTYPKRILDNVVGATMLYTNRKDLSPDQWQRVSITDSKNTSVLLTNLQPGTRYSVQILPELYTGEFAYAAMEQFEMRVDGAEDQSLPNGPPIFPSGRGERFQQMKATEAEYLRIVSCNPEAILSGCAWNELCIARVDDRLKGWCISNLLRDAILNS